MKQWIKRILISLMLMSVIAWVALLIYSLDYSQADNVALSQYENEDVSIVRGTHQFLSRDSDTGFIFYPGGKVEAEAYASLAYQLKSEGINVFIVEMPYKLAVFNIQGANAVREAHPDIKHWFIGGHSLGGAMASAHIDRYADAYVGLILLAAYPINDRDIDRLIIYGDLDGVLNFDSLQPYIEEALVIEGGNHANFANYGEQAGDQVALISKAQQQTLTVNAILSFIEQTCQDCRTQP